MRHAHHAETLGYGEFFGDSCSRRELSGFSIARIVASRPPLEVPDHTHETAHVVLVLEGRYVTAAERAEPGRAPSLIWNPPATAHRDRFVENTGVFLTVSVSDSRLGTFGDDGLPARPVGIASGAAVRVARRLAGVLQHGPRHSTSRAERLCHELFGNLHPERLRRLRPPAWLCSVRETIADRYDEPLRVGELAAAADVHPVHLIRSFHRFFGRTPAEYLRGRRLEVAAELLRSTSLPIVEVALRTGFADQSHFTRAFGRGFGVAPAAYRRGAREAG